MSPVVLGIDTSATVCAGVAVDSAAVASAVVPDTRAHAEQLMPLVQQVVAQAGLGNLAGYDSIAVGVGPGPFTGLRVGVVAAVTLAEALGIPVRGVCSLDVLAHQAVQQALVGTGDFVVATDARRKEWYWASYTVRGTDTGDSRFSEFGTDTGDSPLSEFGTDTGDSPSVPAYPAVSALGGTVPMASSGTSTDAALGGTVSMASSVVRVAGPFVTAPDQVPDLPRVGPVTDTALDLDAGVLAAIASALPEAGLEPLYLRRPDAAVPTGRKPTLLPPRLAPRSPR